MRVMLALRLQRYRAHHQHGKHAYEQQSCARGRKIPRARHVIDTVPPPAFNLVRLAGHEALCY